MSQQSPRYWIALEDAAAVVRVRRTESCYPDLDAVHAGYEDLFAQLDGLGEHRCLLIDLRNAPAARNDESFEAIHRSYRPEWFGRFHRVAALVRSAAGLMQLSRMAREDGGGFSTFDDEARALAWLRE